MRCVSGRDDTDLVWSKTLFGNRHMLRVADSIAAARGSEFTAPEGVGRTKLAGSTVHRLLEDLTTVGLVERLPRERRERTQRYSRRSHPFWDAASLLCKEAVGDAG